MLGGPWRDSDGHTIGIGVAWLMPLLLASGLGGCGRSLGHSESQHTAHTGTAPLVRYVPFLHPGSSLNCARPLNACQ